MTDVLDSFLEDQRTTAVHCNGLVVGARAKSSAEQEEVETALLSAELDANPNWPIPFYGFDHETGTYHLEPLTAQEKRSLRTFNVTEAEWTELYRDPPNLGATK
jgi:hypothetical protein